MVGAPVVLVVDDEPSVRRLVVSQVSRIGFVAEPAANADEALQWVRAEGTQLALVLTDVDMPGTSGVELLGAIKRIDDSIQVVMITGMQDLATVRECLRKGAYDYLIKPFHIEELRNTVDRAVERFRLLRETREHQTRLEQMVQVRTRELRETRDIALLAMGKLAESRDQEIGRHLERIGAFAGLLSRTLARAGRAEIDELFIEQIVVSSALHDIGKVAVPDAILLKPGGLSDEEFRIMRTHTTIGGDTLRQIIERYEGHDYLTMAMDIAYSHHEKWDGTGYPEGLRGDEIPLAARIVAACDAYDAITSVRSYKQALSHEEALRRIAMDRGHHFDPVVADALESCAEDFRTVGRQLRDAAA
jgi:putative two-component system response regulator